MYFLGIETSCDETAVALYHSKQGLIDDITLTQLIHQKYQGVVPELAAREHLKNLPILIEELLKKNSLNLKSISFIGVTTGPGLLSCLLIGGYFGYTLSWLLKKPFISINHLEGHIFSPFIEQKENLKFPYLCLLVSGGHTQIIQVNAVNNYQILGQTIDDSIGEAFDKVAKMLGLSFPGGKEISTLAKKGNDRAYEFSLPLTKSKNLNFSLSGLKTQIKYLIQDIEKTPQGLTEQNKQDIAASFEKNIVKLIIKKLRVLFKQNSIQRLTIVGGVSANDRLRKELGQFAEKNDIQIIFPNLKYCTDNAAMIAFCAYLNYQHKQMNNEFSLNPKLGVSN